jgi:predicted metalloendopeptidase
MDKDVKASNDFFRYVNGTWLDKTEIQATERGSFDELRQSTDADALAILKELNNPKYKSDTDQGRPSICINLF